VKLLLIILSLMKQTVRTTETLMLKGISEDHLVQPPCSKQPLLKQVDQSKDGNFTTSLGILL